MSRLVVLALPTFVALWALGWFRRQSAKSAMSLGNAMLGGTVLFAGLVYLWKNRRDAVTVVAIVTLLVAMVALLSAWWLFPSQRVYLLSPLVAALLVAYMAWDYKHTRGAPLAVVLAGKREEVRARNAVLATHDNARPRTAQRTSDGWRIDVDHTGKIDGELVGQALQSGGAKVVPSDRLGRSTIVLDDKASSPWQAFETVRDWHGPHIRKAGEPIPFGADAGGSIVAIPWIGKGGRHLLTAGSTGAGKSGLVRVLIAEMAHCPDVELVLCDPKMVEFRGWAERAHVATGSAAAGKAFDAVFAEMMRRYKAMPEDQVEWRDGDGKWIVLVVDELAAITQEGSSKERAERERNLGLILAMGRAAGIGVIGCTQRPSHNVLSMDLRDNFRVRIGLGCESLQQTSMVMGDSADKAPCQSIPESLPGACFVRVDRHVTAARSFNLDPLRVREIAAKTAGNKGEAEWLGKY